MALAHETSGILFLLTWHPIAEDQTRSFLAPKIYRSVGYLAAKAVRPCGLRFDCFAVRVQLQPNWLRQYPLLKSCFLFMDSPINSRFWQQCHQRLRKYEQEF